MKTAILTFASGNRHKAILAETLPLMKHYAERIGAEFLLSTTGDEDLKVPHYKKLNLIREALETFDRVAWIDCDVLISKIAPSIFDEVPMGELGIFNEAFWVDRKPAVGEWRQITGFTFPDFVYYNTGVMVVDKSHQHLFKLPDVQLNHFGEQTYLNQKIIESKCRIFALSHHWNRMSCTHFPLGEEPFCSHFIHFAGEVGENLPVFIKQTAAHWETQKQWKGLKTIGVMCSNGAGNQITTVPVIKYLAETHPDYEIYVVTHFKDVFAPIVSEQIKVIGPGEVVPNKFAMWKSTALAGTIQDVCTHPQDFHSISLLQRQLPMEKRNIIVPKTNSPRALPKHTVCIHAGKSAWKSKEAPLEFWQTIVDGLKEKGFHVALIGQRDWGKVKEGYGAFVPKNFDFDFTNVPYADTCDVIKKSWMTLTNDSMPVHAAGGFNNWIGLITIAKRPELILPYRDGKQWDKVKVWTGTPLWEVMKEPLFHAPGTGFSWGDMRKEMAWPDPVRIVDDITDIRDYEVSETEHPHHQPAPTSGANEEHSGANSFEREVSAPS